MITMTGKALVRIPTDEELEKFDYDNWPKWEKEVGEFPWEYHDLIPVKKLNLVKVILLSSPKE